MYCENHWSKYLSKANLNQSYASGLSHQQKNQMEVNQQRLSSPGRLVATIATRMMPVVPQHKQPQTTKKKLGIFKWLGKNVEEYIGNWN